MKVKFDDDIPNIWVQNGNQTTNQTISIPPTGFIQIFHLSQFFLFYVRWFFNTTHLTGIISGSAKKSPKKFAHLKVIVPGEVFCQEESLPLVVLHQDQRNVILILGSLRSIFGFQDVKFTENFYMH